MSRREAKTSTFGKLTPEQVGGWLAGYHRLVPPRRDPPYQSTLRTSPERKDGEARQFRLVQLKLEEGDEGNSC